MSTDAFTNCRYGPESEQTHEFAGIANYNESVYVNFVDPVTQLGGLIRIGNRPTLGYREASVQLTLPGGAIAFRAGREASESNDGFASQGLEIVVKDPTRTVEIGYRNTVARIATPSLLADRGRIALKNAPAEECEISLTFEASVPLFVTTDDDGDCTPGSSTIASDHYEQFGHISGTVRVGDRCWTVRNVSAFRDHSWGPREWASYTGEWLAAWLADGTAITAYGEFEPSGERASGGVVITPDGAFHPITEYTVITDYAGEPAYAGRHVGIVRADGLPLLLLDGTIRHFVPVTQRTEDRGLRMGQMTVDFAGGAAGWGVAEFLRPISRS
ncbi:hypothetical protein [Nocardia sp. alder85J]|uniref:DUF7065 domain-containing protein n=1 Tax=Nocardia sp. alder85J TaxID=2862949 RepID=UPI001CD2F877|nr:hypothetical protein [Nocardia sp. alder85J]MCX4095824.1 hypothetical protein [Nocardia sp. alder85J]